MPLSDPVRERCVMKIKKITKEYEMLCFSADEDNANPHYISKEQLQRDLSVENAVMVFYLIHDREDDKCKCAGKAIVRKSDAPNAAKSIDVSFSRKDSGNKPISISATPTYEYNLSLLESHVAYDVKTNFCAKLTHYIMNKYGSHLFLFINSDDTIRKIANEVGYKPVDANKVMFDQDDIIAISAAI